MKEYFQIINSHKYVFEFEFEIEIEIEKNPIHCNFEIFVKLSPNCKNKINSNYADITFHHSWNTGTYHNKTQNYRLL